MPSEINQNVLDLRAVFGVETRIISGSDATGGAYVEFDCKAEPGAMTLIHYHPEQEESFHVLDGELEVLRDGEWHQVHAAETFTVPKGAVHAWRNVAGTPVRFRNVHRPALGFQAHMESLDRLTRAGKVRGTKDIRSLIYMSMSAVEHRPDVAVKPPQWVVNAMASLGRVLGYTLE